MTAAVVQAGGSGPFSPVRRRPRRRPKALAGPAAWVAPAAALLLAAAADAHAQAGAQAKMSACPQDEPLRAQRDLPDWERSSDVAWKAIEEHGGVVPDVEEDRTQAPPGWWRYPSPLRSAGLLAAEAKRSDGLYVEASAPLQRGDLLVRTRGAGACGKMAMVAEKLDDGGWMTLEADLDGSPTTRTASKTFFDGETLRPDVSAYRIRVRKEDTLGHIRELQRDLTHIERTVAERPPLVVRKGRAAVDQKVHELVDEAWSLVAEEKYDLDRRELAGRALAVGAALDWFGAAESAAAVLDDVLRRAPMRPDAATARAMLLLIAGQPDKAVLLAQAAAGMPGTPARSRYVLGRALVASGHTGEGLRMLLTYLDDEPSDPRARKLLATQGATPALAPAPAAPPGGLRFLGTADEGGLESAALGFRVTWPLTWRVDGLTIPEGGLVVNLATGRVVLPNGEAEQGAASLLAQRPETPATRAALLKDGTKSLFPKARVNVMKPLLPGSRREHFREKGAEGPREGEVTTLEHDGVVYYLALNVPADSYPKLREEYAHFVKTLTFAATRTAPGVPAPPPSAPAPLK